MANPETEIFWGGCDWRPYHRRYIRPYVEGAVELAHVALEHLGVEYHLPKRVRVRRCGNSFPAAAEHGGDKPNTVDLFVRVDDYRRHKAPARFGRYLTASAHELVHAARYERFEGWDLLEEVASEGLAHVTEDLVSCELDIIENYTYTEIVSLMGRNWGKIKQNLARDYGRIQSDPNMADPIIDSWFDWGSPYMDEGAVLGISAVHQRMIQGHTIGEMINWPAERILDL